VHDLIYPLILRLLLEDFAKGGCAAARVATQKE
jgi:hypothetical protein